MKHIRFLAQTAALMVGLSTGLIAQVVETPEGTVEFIGLETWSVSMIKDSMAVHAPTKSLGQCAGVLMDLGFPSAQALGVGNGKTVVVVVDPRYAGKILRRRRVEDPNESLRWPEITGLDSLEHGNALVWPVLFRHWWRAADSTKRLELLASGSFDTTTFRRAVDVLERSSVDHAEAVSVLAKAVNYHNRRAATYILAGTPDLSITWFALTDALLEDDHRVVSAATRALESMLHEPGPTLDWSSQRTELRALLAGTNVSTIRTVLRLLERTGTTNDARAALAQNSHLVIAMLASATPEYKAAAHSFLVFSAGGRDLGQTVADWERWLEGLEVDV